MVSAVNNSPSVLALSQAQSQSNSSSSGASFQQAVDQYTQDTTSGIAEALPVERIRRKR
jgi:hypothetical protein